MRELIARVRALLRRIEHVARIVAADRQRQTEALNYQDLYLNPETFQVSLGETPIDLTRTEFDLLHLFVSNPGRVFSRAYLLDTVWGWDYPAGTRTVDTRIAELRRVLGDDPADPRYIETVPGQGYRFVGLVEAAT